MTTILQPACPSWCAEHTLEDDPVDPETTFWLHEATLMPCVTIDGVPITVSVTYFQRRSPDGEAPSAVSVGGLNGEILEGWDAAALADALQTAATWCAEANRL